MERADFILNDRDPLQTRRCFGPEWLGLGSNFRHSEGNLLAVARRLLQFGPHRLTTEHRRLKGYPWIRNPSSMLHDNTCFALPLFAVSGVMEKMITKEGEFRPTPALLETQSFKQVIDFFRCPLKRVRFLLLKAGASIHEHADEAFYGDQETINIHIPFLTNPTVQFVVGGGQFHMQPGECWCIDTLQPHSVSNRGSTDRIHLMIHCMVNPFITELLAYASLVLYSPVKPKMQ
jgi:hypothetical protein